MAMGRLKVVFMQEALNFIEEQPQSVGDKILDNIHRIEKGEQNVKLFKKLVGTHIWEFRTHYRGIQYRLFAFWDTESEALVIATHGIVKKTQKAPSREIARAEKIRQEYFKEKQK
ncbi:MAG: type II toxin-antitoxin system RelE/ParE family toxin [Muribaculaceae bacterium]|nr:type II toxin-antitoxin system RelE/ParE family toxin [Muribaculaceae bacterium]